MKISRHLAPDMRQALRLVLARGVYLPPAVSGEIWQGTVDSSAFMQLTSKIDLPGSGVSVVRRRGRPSFTSRRERRRLRSVHCRG